MGNLVDELQSALVTRRRSRPASRVRTLTRTTTAAADVAAAPEPAPVATGALPSVTTAARAPELASSPILDRLRRVEGQVRGIQRMIERQQDCEAVLTQILAARAALDRVAGQVVSSHLEECLAGRSPTEARAAIERAVRLLARGG